MKTRTDAFWSNIKPLLAPSAIRAQAYAELLHVFREALRIGFLKLATPAHFDIDYPTLRPVTWFDARYDYLPIALSLTTGRYAFTPSLSPLPFSLSSPFPYSFATPTPLLRLYAFTYPLTPPTDACTPSTSPPPTPPPACSATGARSSSR